MSGLMIKYNVVIIDDERLAREEIKRQLSNHDGFNIVGEASNADEGKTIIQLKQPHLIFLDIHMPQKSGFDLLNDLTILPEIVFTTAHSEYAAKAFDINAIDYLVKPIREERFIKSIEKVREKLTMHETGKELSIHHKVFIKDGRKCHLVPLSDIRYIESIENYARFHFNDETAMMKKSLNLLEKKLDPSIFFRINRSKLINTNFISQVHPSFNNRLKIVLSRGEIFEVSSRQSVRFKSWNSL